MHICLWAAGGIYNILRRWLLQTVRTFEIVRIVGSTMVQWSSTFQKHKKTSEWAIALSFWKKGLSLREEVGCAEHTASTYNFCYSMSENLTGKYLRSWFYYQDEREDCTMELLLSTSGFWCLKQKLLSSSLQVNTTPLHCTQKKEEDVWMGAVKRKWNLYSWSLC